MISIEESRSKFQLAIKELYKTLELLSPIDEVSSHNSRKVGVYKLLKKLVPCFDVLYNVTDMNSISSLFTISRMIIDNYSIYYLLTSNSTEEEKNIRYYLYLIDGVKTQSHLIKNFHSKTFDSVKELTENQNQAKQENNLEIFEILKGFINQNNTNNIVTDEIINQGNWKFKDGHSIKHSKQNSFSWTDMYKMAKIPDHYSLAFQNYFSSHSHGLGMSLMTQPESNNELSKSLILFTSSIIASMVVKISIVEYPAFNIENHLDVDFKHDMNLHWENWYRH